MKTSFILSLIIIGLGLIIYLLLFKKKKSLKTNIFIAIVTCIIATAILVFPLLEYDNAYVKAFASYIYATRCMGMSQNLNVLSNIDINTSFGYAYFILINLLFLALPCLTIGFVITYIEKVITFFKLKFTNNKKICVFSELNDKSLAIAKNLKKECTIVFLNTLEKTEINMKAIKLNKRVTEINLNSKNDVTFYILYSDEERNLVETLELIDKYHNRDNTKIYVVNQSEEATTILDSTDKGKIQVEIINEKERMIFNLLDNKPLYLNCINKTISILIVGCGNIGKEFLKDSVWCGMLPNYKLRILVVDSNANKIKDSIDIEAPELLDNYDIAFINGDIKSKEVIKKIKERNDINYIMVSMNNDDKNIETSIMLRRLFLREYNRVPIINLYIENKYKQEQILKLVNEKGYEYNFNAFGSINDLYEKDYDKSSNIENLAIKVNLAYDPNDKDLHNYNLREYNKRSSRASALHLKYKLYAVLGDKYTLNMKENQRLFREMYSEKLDDLLSRNEHDRWTAYVRSMGYIYVSTDKVAKYYEKNKHYIHYLAKMHPSLVEYDKLDDVSKELSKITKKEINLKESDSLIIRLLYKIDL